MARKRLPTPIPFPLSTAPGRETQESGGRLINAYSEPLSEDSAPADRIYRRTPGLRNFGTTTRSGFRGGVEIAGVIYTAWGERLVKHTSAGGAATDVGALAGTKKGFFARNNAATPDQVFVDPDGNVATFTASAVTTGYPDPDLPSPNSVTDLDGYIVFGIGDGRVFATDLNSTAVNPLSFAKAESKPDGIVRVITHAGRLLLMGTNSTEIWTNVGTTPFPFARAVVVPKGLAGPYAIAGHENGFSQAPMWIGDDNAVHQLVGYATQKVSSPDLDRLIARVSDKTTLEASVYMSDGHPFWLLSSPTWSWVFDYNTGKWHERASHGTSANRRSRITGCVLAFGKWLCGDTDTGNVQEIASAVFNEVGTVLPLRIESGPVMDFPNRLRVARADFLFTVGVGIATGADPQETTPKVEISWSDDGGRTWSNPLVRDLGRQSEGNVRITLLNTGVTGPYGRRWRIDVFDPVYVGFMGATMSADPRLG